MKFYLAREGVAFGPYSEFQVRESVRLGIFETNDLALAENGKEWLEISRLLPPASAPDEQPAKKATTLPAKEPRPLEQQDQAAAPTSASSPRKVERGRMTLAAVAAGVTLLCLLVLIASRQRRESPVQARTPIRPPTNKQVVQKLPKAKPNIAATPVVVGSASPAQVVAASTPEGASTPPPTASAAPLVLAMPTPDAPPEPPAATLPPIAKIEGQMFIAGPNGLNYEPPAVEVRLYPLAQLKPYLERRNSEASEKFEELKSQIADAEAEKERLRKVSDAAFDAYVQAEAGSANKATLEQASVEAKKARERATNAYYDLLQNREDTLSGAFYVENLPKSISTTQTDIHGRFVFNVSAEGDFAVVAGVQRNEEESAKRYYWFIPVTVAGEPTKDVLLSNNNLSSQGSAESLVLTVD